MLKASVGGGESSSVAVTVVTVTLPALADEARDLTDGYLDGDVGQSLEAAEPHGDVLDSRSFPLVWPKPYPGFALTPLYDEPAQPAAAQSKEKPAAAA